MYKRLIKTIARCKKDCNNSFEWDYLMNIEKHVRLCRPIILRWVEECIIPENTGAIRHCPVKALYDDGYIFDENYVPK